MGAGRCPCMKSGNAITADKLEIVGKSPFGCASVQNVRNLPGSLELFSEVSGDGYALRASPALPLLCLHLTVAMLALGPGMH